MDDGTGVVDTAEIKTKAWVWIYTSPGGACHQGPRQYKRRADAQRAGHQWLEARGQQR